MPRRAASSYEPTPVSSEPSCGYYFLGLLVLGFLIIVVKAIALASGISGFMRTLGVGFVICGDVNRTFEDNLTAILSNSSFRGKLFQLMITCSIETRKEMLLRLHDMNMNRATLFPGLQGFSESLRTRLVKPETLLALDSLAGNEDSTSLRFIIKVASGQERARKPPGTP